MTLPGLSATPFLEDKGGEEDASEARVWRHAQPRRDSGRGAVTGERASSALDRSGVQRLKHHVERSRQLLDKGVGARERRGPEAPLWGIAEIRGQPKSERGGNHLFLAETQVLEPTYPFSGFPRIFTFCAGASSPRRGGSGGNRGPPLWPHPPAQSGVRAAGPQEVQPRFGQPLCPPSPMAIRFFRGLHPAWTWQHRSESSSEPVSYAGQSWSLKERFGIPISPKTTLTHHF